LFLKKHFPEDNITVFESDKHQIIGVGEGTTPHFVEFTDFLGIPISELITKTSATIKIGIQFDNWNGSNSSYFHPFRPFGSLGYPDYSNSYISGFNDFLMSSFIDNMTLDETDFYKQLSDSYKVPAYISEDSYDNGFVSYNFFGPYAVHFDALELASFLKETAVVRGVVYENKEVLDVVVKNERHIDSLILEDDDYKKIDFVFDCSGRGRKIINKIAKNNWNDLNSKFLADSAFVFSKKNFNNKKPITKSTAKEFGWMWEIPLQEKIKYGYVHNSTDSEKVLKNINDMGFNAEEARRVSFDSGYLKEPWVGNCVAIGMSSGFLEPLEATSIWTILKSLSLMLNFQNIFDFNVNRKSYNNAINIFYEAMSEFIYFHYLGIKINSNYWNTFSLDKSSEWTKEKVKIWSNNFPSYDDFYGKPEFSIVSWIKVASGVGLINKKNILKNNHKKFDTRTNIKYMNEQNINAFNLCHSHLDFLKNISGRDFKYQ